MRTESPTDHRPRMKPPASLTDTERAVWKAVTKAVSSDHFQDCDRVLLVEFCRAACLADAAAKALQDGAVVDGKASAWIAVQEKAQRALVALSARLRLCPQSRFDRLKAGTNARTGMPVTSEERPKTGLASFRKWGQK